MEPLAIRIISAVLLFVAVYLAVRYGYGAMRRLVGRVEGVYDRALRGRLMMDVEPRQALVLTVLGAAVIAAFAGLVTGSVAGGVIAMLLSLALPYVVIRHLEAKRLERLDSQLVDGLVTLASAVRAGLTMVQAIELLVQNHTGPIRQEFAQMLREYELGADLNQAMRTAADRINSPLYRLTFTAIATHRARGGDAAESLDRIADSVREIHRLEGKLDAITAQGRSQALMMAVMPAVFLGLLYLIDPSGVALLFGEPIGRLILLGVVALIAIGWWWIRRIMDVEM